MCEYCGCLEVPAIAQLTAEHDEIRAVAREAGRAGHAGEYDEAVSAARRLLGLLGPHTAVEEQGLLPAMAGEFAEHIDSLEADHQRIDHALAELASGTGPTEGWAGRLEETLSELFEHILREQDGLFPATLSVLTPEQWDHLDAVRTQILHAR
jgi:hemerythrin-like domain-containing protein